MLNHRAARAKIARSDILLNFHQRHCGIGQGHFSNSKNREQLIIRVR